MQEAYFALEGTYLNTYQELDNYYTFPVPSKYVDNRYKNLEGVAGLTNAF